MTRDLFEQWILDDDPAGWHQDEDLMISMDEDLVLLEEFLQRSDVPPAKRATILSAICIVLYDNAGPDIETRNPHFNPQSAASAAEILKRNPNAFDSFSEARIDDYIKVVVYPVIGRIFQLRDRSISP
ncbi:MAG: hypothetical protein EOP86_17460 [Verrucomicrobiaceae bacterium]|nr:MAG: hypothetical protein EOP86_17460 [Verrucomicrobiaceae bacterium]